VRGFLRTYGAILGLDGEMLADEFRRRYEEPAAASPAAEPVLRGRRRASRANGSGTGSPSRGTLIAAVAAGIVILLIALSLLGGGDDEPTGTPDGLRDASGKSDGGKGNKGGGGGDKGEPREPIDLELEALGTAQVCVATEGQALVDGQVLAAGATESFSGEKRYRIDLPEGGELRVDAGDGPEKLSADGEASWEANSNGISEIDYAGPDCP
jgi:hypothetical protein